MNSDDLSAVESLHNTFFYFAEGLNVMASNAAMQRESIGGPHVAWELQNDVLDHGEAVLSCAGSFLGQEERADIVSLLDKVKKLSVGALGSDAKALDHPEWEVLRSEATRLLVRLSRPIAENRAFFQK